MKIIYPVLLLFIWSFASASDPRVVYKTATDELNDEAVRLIEENFSTVKTWEDIHELFGKILFCPAGLWEQIQNDDIFAGMDKGVMKSRVPKVKKNKVRKMIQRDGKVFQGTDEIEKFWVGFTNQIKLEGTPKVRKLSELEIDVLWTMIAWPISEPLFICEWENHQLLLQFQSDLKIGYIDELQDYIDGDFFRRK